MKRFVFMVVLALVVFAPGGSLAVGAEKKQPPQAKGEISLSFAPVVKQVAPAVVNIYTTRTVTRRYGHPFLDDPFFQQFFGNSFGTQEGLRREQVQGALGSGVIMQEDGLVVTNAHVIKGADAIKVVLGDGREFDATMSLIDEPSDLALLRMETRGEKMPYAMLKSSDDLEVGDLVLAIGNPFGVGQTVTSGIISALSRSSLDINNYNFFIQTDAAINPGNSGGPLVAMDGGVVGINTAIYSRSGGSLGIGFAIPSEMVRAVIAAEKGDASGASRIRRPWLGVVSQAVTSDMAESLGLQSPRGTLISSLHPASPLKKAGARVGDVILSMNGKTIRNAEEMRFRMATLPLGEMVDVGLYREGRERILKVKTIAPPEDPPRQETWLETGLFSGARVANINPAVIAELGGLRHDDSGVVITAVRTPGAASRFLRPGDIIQSVNGVRIAGVVDLKKALNTRASGWNVVFSRDGKGQQIVIR